MKKILIYHTFAGYGGIENQIVNVVKALRDDYEFFFATTPNQRLLNELKLLEVKILPPLSTGTIRKVWDVVKMVKKNSIDVIQVHTFSDAIFIRLVKLLCPRVKIVYRVHTYIACSWIPNYKKKLYYFLDSITSFAIKRYIVNGKYMMDEFSSNTFIKNSKLRYMLDGIKEAGKYTPLTHYQTPVSVLMIANVIPHKGHDIIAKTSSILKEDGYIFKVKVLGDYERNQRYYEEIQSLIDSLDVTDVIDYIGFDKNIQKHLLHADLVVLPSDSEGTPNCIMEGMSMGKIVICTDTGGLREMIDDGINGYLCKPFSPKDFASVMSRAFRMTDNEIEKMSVSGYNKWKDTMSISAMKKNLLKIYNEVI